MTREKIQLLLFETLKEVQELSGEEWKDLPPSAVPLEDLACFDSLTSVEATAIIEEKLGCNELDCKSIFISDDKAARALSIEEIIEKVENLIVKKE